MSLPVRQSCVSFLLFCSAVQIILPIKSQGAEDVSCESGMRFFKVHIGIAKMGKATQRAATRELI
jgi:hypothetical protein